MPKIYTTVQGDTWDIVSLHVYGTEKKMGELIAANPKQQQTTIFPAGVVLTAPDLPQPVKTNLPPWKRG